jgi:hypothetical protein
VLGYYGSKLDRALELEDTPTPALLRSLFEHMGTGIEQVQQFYRGVFREIAKMQLGLDEGGAAARERELCVGRLAALMARGQARGELSSAHDPRDLAYAFDSLSNGTIIHWLYDDTTKSLSERMLRAVEIFLRSVSVPDEPRAEGPLPDLGGPVPVAVQDLPQAGTE